MINLQEQYRDYVTTTNGCVGVNIHRTFNTPLDDIEFKKVLINS